MLMKLLYRYVFRARTSLEPLSALGVAPWLSVGVED